MVCIVSIRVSNDLVPVYTKVTQVEYHPSQPI